MTDWSGAEYAERSALQRAAVTDALGALSVHPGMRVVDIGCGDGYLTRALAARAPGGLVVGLDASPRMIATAHAAASPGAAGPVFAVADARDLPVAPGFDLVVSFNALHWVPEQQRALAAIGAVLKPGGVAVVQMVCAGGRASVESTAMTVCSRERWSRWFEGFAAPFVHVEPDVYRDLAAEEGLVQEDRTVSDLNWDFGSRDAFLRWCAMGMTAWTDRLPPGARDDFVAELVAAYEPVAGRAGLFRYTQMRATLRRD